MEGVTFVSLPSWAAAVLSVLFAAAVAWAISDRVRVGDALTIIRDRLARIETKLENLIRRQKNKDGDED